MTEEKTAVSTSSWSAAGGRGYTKPSLIRVPPC
jgi:hypothetical protein